MDRLLECALFVVGLVFGSFLNVCISRIPRDQSIVSPPSHCPSCRGRLRWYDNIPLVSFLVLRGRCRACGKRISWRYPGVELLTGICFAGVFLTFGFTWLTLKFCIFSFLLIGLVFMDAETHLLPREFTYTGIVLGLAFAWNVPTDYSGTGLLLRIFGRNLSNVHALSLVDAALGALTGTGFFYLAWAAYYLVRREHGLGFGDIALMGMSGAFLGLKLVLLVIVLSPFAGLLYVVFLLLQHLVQRSVSTPQETSEKPFLLREIPFGVFLGSCSLFAVFWGELLWAWYLRLF